MQKAHLEVGPFDRDFAGGLLVDVVAALRAVAPGALVGVTTTRDVHEPFAQWARLTGNALIEAAVVTGGWRYVVRSGAATQAPEPERAIGSRLWLYTNFDCNLACDYCCVRSSPTAERRALGLETVQRVAREARELGVGELFVTGGEPFLLDDIGEMLLACAAAAPTTVLTNGMLFSGRRRAALDAAPRDRLVLQISIDSPLSTQHDARRGGGSWTKAWRGVEIAREMGFRIRIAATVGSADQERDVLEFFDSEGLAPEDRVVRNVALRGFATDGVALTLTDLVPEPTITATGVYWHPVGATDDDFFVTSTIFPLAQAIETVRVMHASERAFADTLASVFVCS